MVKKKLLGKPSSKTILMFFGILILLVSVFFDIRFMNVHAYSNELYTILGLFGFAVFMLGALEGSTDG